MDLSRCCRAGCDAGALKEGWPTLSPLYVLGVAAILVVLIFVWHRMWVKVGQPTKQRMYYVGILLPTAPLLFYGWIGGMMTYYHLRAGIFESRVAISRYHDTAVYWPGFTQPVGVRLELDIDVPFSMPGSLLVPRIVIANSNTLHREHTAIGNYFQYCTLSSDSNLCLTVPLSPYRPPPTIPGGGTLHLVYELFPANVEYLEDFTRLCLKEATPEINHNWGEPRALVVWVRGGHRHRSQCCIN